MAIFILRARGFKPLLTRNPYSMQMTQASSRRSKVPSAEQEAEAGTYRDEEGFCCLPGEAFTRAIAEAGGAWKQPRRRASMRALLEHLEPTEPLTRILTADGKPRKDYEIFRKRVIVQRAGVIRARPLFDPWMAEVAIEYDEMMLPDVGLIADIAVDAGRRIGVGDYRPRYGRFNVIQVSEIPLQQRQAAE